MSERANLVSLFREVDRSVVAFGDEVAEDVGVVLEPYRAGAAGWFERYRSSVDATFDEGVPTLADALEQMSIIENDIEPAKRVIASAALARADPQTFLPPPGDTQLNDVTLLVEVLRPVMHPENQTQEKGFELLRLLGGSDEEGNVDLALKYDWQATLAVAVERQLLEARVAHDAAQCCHGSWMNVAVEGEEWPASVLTTSFSTAVIDLPGLSRYLSPENWPGCCSLWCDMRRLNVGGSPACYLEHISFGCPGPWHLKTCLEFVRTDLDQAVSLEYQRCHDAAHLPESDHVVRVDEGSIVAVQEGPQVRVTSTKRVSFRGPFDAPSFAMWACVLGYGEAAREMVFRCASDVNKAPSQAWQADLPQGGASVGGQKSAPAWPADQVDHLTEVAAEGIRSSGQAFKDFAMKLSTTGASSEEIVKAAAAMWTEPALAMLRLCSPAHPVASTPRSVHSDPFSAGSLVAPQVRQIVVSDPLVSGFGHRIEVAALRAEPPVLPPGEHQFRIAAEIVNQRAGIYRGAVTVVDDLGAAGAQSAGVPVQVWLQVS